MNDKKIIIVSKDGNPFELDYGIAKQSRLLLVEMDKENYTTPAKIELVNIHSSILERIVSYLVYHKEVDDTLNWDIKFIENFTGNELIDLIWSANYLKVDDLYNLGKTRLLNVFDNNEISQVRSILSIQPDFTKDEEKIVKSNFYW